MQLFDEFDVFACEVIEKFEESIHVDDISKQERNHVNVASAKGYSIVIDFEVQSNKFNEGFEYLSKNLLVVIEAKENIFK